MTVIKNGQPSDNAWLHLDDEEEPGASPYTVSLERWQRDKGELVRHGLAVGVRLNPSDSPDLLADDLATLPIVVLDMGPFTDGRSFSQARILRERLGFAGEIRARGDFLRDQMFFLNRVGVNAFEFPSGADLNEQMKAFQEFSVTYQAATDTKEPLYRRR